MKSKKAISQNLRICITLLIIQLLLSSCSFGPLGNSRAAGEKTVSMNEGSIISIVWSGVGDKIAITNHRIAETQVFIYDFPTRRLEGYISGGNLLVEDWHPTDDILLISRNKSSPDDETQEGIWILSLENNEIDFLVSGDHAAFSPDGKTVAVLDSTGALISIRLVDSITRQEETVFSKKGADLSSSGITWSPDGQKLLFDMRDSSGYRNDLFLLDLETSTLSKATEDGYNYSGTWSPDGKMIAYIGSNLDWGTSYVVLASMDQPTCNVLLAGTERAASSAFSPQGALAYSVGGDLFYISNEAIIKISPIHCD